MQQLRTHLEQDQYLDYLNQMSANGYRLFGMTADDDLVALAGVDILTNLYYGRHWWVYDLVTDSDHRSMGFGEQLFDFLAEWAEDKIALSSGLQREQAHRFYEEHIDMNRASYVFLLEIG